MKKIWRGIKDLSVVKEKNNIWVAWREEQVTGIGNENICQWGFAGSHGGANV